MPFPHESFTPPASRPPETFDAQFRRVRGKLLDRVEQLLDEMAAPEPHDTTPGAIAAIVRARVAPLFCTHAACRRAGRCRHARCPVAPKRP